MADEQLFWVRDRRLDYPVFDVDNHMYENTDAFTKYLPREYQGLIKYIGEGDRTRIAVKDRIDRGVPNPTFTRVAPPGGQADDPLKRRSIAGLDAFFDVEPRFKNSMWGSDFPHPEGMRDPLAFVEDIASMPAADQRSVMGGNLARLIGVA